MSREAKRHAAREERRTAAPSAPAEAAKQRTSPARFLQEVRSELKKVAWPSRHEVVNYTIVVLVVTTALTLLIFAMDNIISRAVINLFE